MKVLIMGLSGTGKTTLAYKMSNFGFAVFDGDAVRLVNENFNFSIEARIKQARFVGSLVYRASGDAVGAIICPTKECRDAFLFSCPGAKIIWMNTKNTSQYPDTDEIFENPDKCDLIIKDFNYSVNKIIEDITGGI